jgi:predicted negative regulator of RcsB-dependent stress response
MKKAERERLKHNETADALAAVSLYVAAHGRTLLLGAVAVVVVVASALGYMAWRDRQEEKAQVMLADAIAVANEPVTQVSLDPDVAASPGAFATAADRTDAVIERLLATADAYPSTEAGIQARYYAASLLAEDDRLDAAAGAYQAVIDRAGRSITGRMAKLGLASVQVRAEDYDPAIQTFQDLATAGTDLPIDGILMHLGEAYLQAGRTSEAREVMRRIVNEFPQSPYAADARQKLDALQVVDLAKAS